MMLLPLLGLMFAVLAATAESTAMCRRYFLVIGETGFGKSTLLENGLRIPGVGVAGEFDFDSYTSATNCFPVSDPTSPFHGDCFCDTPGLYDTSDVPNDVLLAGISTEILKHAQNQRQVDGIILLLNPCMTKLRLNLLDLIAEFSDHLLASMVVVLNQHDCPNVQDRSNRVATKVQDDIKNLADSNGLGLPRIPPVLKFSCKSPTEQDIRNLDQALAVVSKYDLKNVEEKKAAIKAIFDKLMADPANYETIISNIIKSTIEKVTNQQVINDNCKISVRKCVGTNSVKFKPFGDLLDVGISIEKPVMVDEDHIVPCTKVVDVMTQVVLQNSEPKEDQKLKNSEEYYWKLAAETHKMELSTKWSLGRKQQQQQQGTGPRKP